MKKLSLLASAVALTASSLFGDIAVGKGLTVSGYLDFVYNNVSNDLPAATADTNGFDSTAAEIDFAFDFGNGLSATIDLESGVTSRNAADTNVEQARLDYSFGDSTITVGKFDTVIGLEGLEAPDLYQISNSLTFDLEPTQHTGIMYGYDNGMFNFNLGLVNSIVDDNSNAGSTDDLSYLAHIGLTPTESLSFNANYAQGDEAGILDDTGAAVYATGAVAGSATPDELTLFTVDASWSDFGWTLGAEYVSSDLESSTGAQVSDATGYMLMVNYMFTEQFGLTARYSAVDDDQTAGTADDLETTEWTISPSYAVTPNWFLLAEYRMEETDTNGTASTEKDTISLESVLTF